jgi:hypothetical protein
MMHAHELLLAAATLVVAMPAIAAHGDKDHVRVELIAEKSALVPGAASARGSACGSYTSRIGTRIGSIQAIRGCRRS